MMPLPDLVQNLPYLLPETERLDMLRLARTNGVGPINFCRLMCLYGQASVALDALPERMAAAGRSDGVHIPSRSDIEDELERLRKMGGRAILRSDPDYPALLTHVPDAPPVLFIQGDAKKLSARSIGVVGARNASSAGIRMSGSLSTELASAGLCVVSGLARGIDSAAHEGALPWGLTVAAIAGGLDYFYPPENAKLQAEIAEKGCIVTEAPLGTVPQARHFPRRNRLIAGMTQGCVIVEAALKSGTLITARLAAQYDRILFSVPGSPLDPRSRGGNDLLRHGAVVTENAQDVLNQLGLYLPPRNPAPWEKGSPQKREFSGFSEPSVRWGNSQEDVPEDLQSVLRKVRPLLSVTPVAVDDVVRHCQFSVSAILTALTELELGGIVEFVPGGRVALLPNR